MNGTGARIARGPGIAKFLELLAGRAYMAQRPEADSRQATVFYKTALILVAVTLSACSSTRIAYKFADEIIAY